jgi:peptidoglycan biosynthesis protein MviN/MurJ (putative lipid II flippase)
MQDTRTPAIVNIAAALVNVGADLVYVALGWGVPGLALGHATSYLFATIVCLILLRRRLDRVDARRIARTLVRLIPASILAAGAAFLAAIGIRSVFGTDANTLIRLLQVVAGVLAGVLVFVISTLIVKIEEADEVKDAVLRRSRR